jgi:hypothetical protein
MNGYWSSCWGNDRFHIEIEGDLLPYRLAVHREGLWGLCIGLFLNGKKSSPFHGKAISPSLSMSMGLRDLHPCLQAWIRDLHPCLRAWVTDLHSYLRAWVSRISILVYEHGSEISIRVYEHGYQGPPSLSMSMGHGSPFLSTSMGIKDVYEHGSQRSPSLSTSMDLRFPSLSTSMENDLSYPSVFFSIEKNWSLRINISEKILGSSLQIFLYTM